MPGVGLVRRVGLVNSLLLMVSVVALAIFVAGFNGAFLVSDSLTVFAQGITW